jgi:hypothetical protein
VANRVTITVDGKEKFVGMLEGGTLRITRERKKHHYRKLNAYGIDRELVDTVLPDLCCERIELTEKETGDVYEVDFELFRRKALPAHYHGHGKQLMLPLRYWTKI